MPGRDEDAVRRALRRWRLTRARCWRCGLDVTDPATIAAAERTIVQSVLSFLWGGTKDEEACKEWCELNDKYLFRSSQP
jgi:hypothetical protein